MRFLILKGTNITYIQETVFICRYGTVSQVIASEGSSLLIPYLVSAMTTLNEDLDSDMQLLKMEEPDCKSWQDTILHIYTRSLNPF